jgi:hypothetical protein
MSTRRGAARMHLDLDGALPGWTVRVTPPLLVLLCAAITGGGQVVWGVAVVLAAVLVWRPEWPTAAAVPVAVGAWVLYRPDLLGAQGGLGVLRLALLLLVTHLVLRAGGLAPHVGWDALVERAVVARALGSVLVVQALVQLLLVGAAALRSGIGETGLDWLRLMAVPATILLALLVVPREWFDRRRRPVQ